MARCYSLYFLIFLIFLFTPEMSAAQVWSTTIAHDGLDYVYDVYQRSDGTFILGGVTEQFSDPNYSDALLVKLDSSGTIVWQKTFGDTSLGEGFWSVRPTSPDGGYIAAGVGQSPNYDIYVVKVTDQGSLQWQKRYMIQSDARVEIYSVRQAEDGGYILGGYAWVPNNVGDIAGIAVKLNSSGNLVWQKRYEVDSGTPDTYVGGFTSLEATSDGGAIAAGFVGGCPGTCFNNLWIVKINSSGGMSWQKNYGNAFIGFGLYPANQQIKVVAGGYALFASDGGNGFWFLKLDTAGDVDFHRLYSYPDPIYNPWIFSMDQSSDGNYFLSGIGYSNEEGQWNAMIVKLDSSGNLSWAKTSPGNGLGVSLSKTSDNGFVLSGPFSNTCNNDQDIEIIKLDSAGTSCEFTGTGGVVLQPEPPITSQTLPTTVISAGLSNVTSNAVASNTTAVQNNQCSAGARALSECGLFFYIIDQDCGANQTCIDERKVLISKTGTTDVYPSEFQEAVPPPKDRKILIKGSVSDSQGNLIPERDVYLRVKDPPDSSPYLASPSPDDNIDKTGGNGGTLSGCITQNPCKVKSDSQGQFQATLEVTSGLECTAQNHIPCAPSGDNYQVEGSFTADFACSPSCTKTGVITAWKRVYIERDKMFRMGGLLAANAVKYQTSILVKGATAKLCAGDPTPPPSACCDSNTEDDACYQIALFDAVNTFEAPGSEQPWVDFIEQEGSNWRLHLATSQNGNTAYPIQKSLYAFSTYPDFYIGGNQPHGKSAGIGRLDSGFFELSTGTGLVETAFKDAFVETKTTSTQIGAMPFLPVSFFEDLEPQWIRIRRFAKIWFNNCLPGGPPGQQDYSCLPNNHFQLLGIDRDPKSNWGFSWMGSNCNFISSGLIETRCSPGSPEQNCKQFTSTHEFAHQFGVNVCSGVPKNHDQQLAWCSNPPAPECNNLSTVQCVMYLDTPVPQRSDGIDRFEIKDLFLGYCPYQPDSIRKATDPK